MTSVLLALSALVGASALTAPAAAAAAQTGRPATVRTAVPAGWEVVEGDEVAALNGGADGKRSSASPGPAAQNLTAQDADADELSLIAMQSVRNQRFVTTEKNYPAPNTGALRARSAEYGGSWEGFAFEWDETTETYALRSLANDLYVAVEKNFTGSSQNLLRARSTGVGGWERFVVYYNAELDRWALQSTLNGLFVAMENGYTGSLQYALRARSAEIGGSWEEFVLYDLGA
ncbi:fascin domain-containing protein [Streptomyces mangrovi]|uniref:fascin domain-containing protein n=1 Tax=Streptomyces mangrovi TaxID=1206892 RepID=UPI00399D137B